MEIMECLVPIPVIDLLPKALPTPLDEGGIKHVEVDGSDGSNILEIPEPQQSLTRVHLQLPKTITTKANQFGVYRKYMDRPTYEPDGLLTLEELGVGNDTATNNENPSDSEDYEMGSQLTHYPFPNTSQSLLSSWYFGSRSGEHSAANFNELCKLISDTRFQPREVRGFTAAKRDACIDRYSELEDGGTIGGGGGGWQRNVEVPISIPEGRQNWTSEKGETYNVPGFHHKSIIQIIRTWFETQVNFHYTPFELWWKSASDAPPMCLYADISSSEAFKQAYLEVD
ncbi:hypothetical protein M422DRAFT_44689 [Sphaerobolus stellatus SS14]|nr:hypothetical protein M422DRAFT_44689 [Sphaerobolus stellatus SS14]